MAAVFIAGASGFLGGPGRRWPLVLQPLYWILGCLPPTRAGAQRLGLVTLGQMAAALTRSIGRLPVGLRVWEVPQIRARE